MPSEMYLDIVSAKTGKSIGGDSTTKGFENLIHVKKYTISMTSPEDYSTKQATAKPHIEDVEFDIVQGAASATLVAMLTTNEQISMATLKVLKTAGTDKTRLYMEWRFKNGRLTSYKQGNDAEVVTDTIRIGYVIGEVDSYQQKSDGNMSPKRSAQYDGNTAEGGQN